MRVQVSARVSCHACTVRENKGAGFLAHTFGTLEVTDCNSERDRYGGCILEASTLTAKNLTVHHAYYDGFEIRSRCCPHACGDLFSITFCAVVFFLLCGSGVLRSVLQVA